MKKKKNDKNNKNKPKEKKEKPQPKYVTKNNSQITVVGTAGYNVVSTTLPNNFFQGLLIKEMELNNEFTMEKLLGLVGQYSLAIEYYLQIDPMKAKAYQNRMEYLLTNKDTLVQLSKHKSGKPDENEKKEPVKNKKVFNETKQYVKLKQEDLKLEDISKQVNTVLDKGNKKEEVKKSVQNLINDDIQKQNENWKEKIKNKKKKNLRATCRETLGGSLFLKKKSNEKNKDKFVGISVRIKGNDEIKQNKDNYENIFDDVEEVNEEVYVKEDKNQNNENKKNNNEEIKENKDNKENKENNDNKDNNDNKNNEDKKEENKKEDIKDEENKIIDKKDENNEINDINEKKGNKVEEDKDKNENENKDKNEEGKKNENEDKKIEENVNKEKKEEEKKEDKKEEDKKEENKIEENKKEEIKEEDKKEEDKKEENENKKIEENKEKEGNNNKNEGNIENIIYNLMLEQEEEELGEEQKDAQNQKSNQQKDEKTDKKLEENSKNEILDNLESPSKNRTSIVDEDMIRKMKPDEEISKSIDEQIKTLQDIITNLNIKKTLNLNENDNNNEDDEDSQNEESNKNSDYSNSNNNLNKIICNGKNDVEDDLIDSTANKIPAKFLSTYYQVESLLIEYMNNFNELYYHDIFEQFSSGLKELYEMKYKKYIEIRNEYHNQIKEYEYLLENDDNLNEEKKNEIQQTIDSLNEEQQHQIDSIEDEFNRKIIDKISEFKLNSFKHNSGIQLLEEQLKLNIYSLINESFY